MPKIHIVPEDVDVYQLPYILLALIGREIRIAAVLGQFPPFRGEIFADVGQLFIYTLFLVLLEQSNVSSWW